MTSGQTLLVLGAAMLFGLLSLSVNETLLANGATAVEARALSAGLGVCREALEQRTAAGFDSLAVGVSYSDTVQTGLAAFYRTVAVDYVEAAAPDSAVAGPTGLKRVSAAVSSDYAIGQVSLSAVVGKF
jgi:hypothetical protein